MQRREQLIAKNKNWLSAFSAVELSDGNLAILRKEYTNKVEIINPKTNELVHTFEFNVEIGGICLLDNDYLAICFLHSENGIEIYNPKTGEKVQSFACVGHHEYLQTAVKKFGDYIITMADGCIDAPVTVVNTKTNAVQAFKTQIHIESMLVMGDKLVLFGGKWPLYTTECYVYDKDFNEIKHYPGKIFQDMFDHMLIHSFDATNLDDHRVILHDSGSDHLAVFDINTGLVENSFHAPELDPYRNTKATLNNGNIAICASHRVSLSSYDKILEYTPDGKLVNNINTDNIFIHSPLLLKYTFDQLLTNRNISHAKSRYVVFPHQDNSLLPFDDISEQTKFTMRK